MAQKTVAIIGASTNRQKFGNKSVRAHRQQGWTVYPVNPSADEVEGVKAYGSLREIPERLDRISLYLPPSAGMKVLPEIAEANPGEFFVNPGAESEELVEEARRLGLDPILACSIINVGEVPEDFPA